LANNIKTNYFLLIYPVIAFFLVITFIDIPKALDWVLLIFLSVVAIIDRINSKVFTSFSYSFSTVILGLLIFDPFSIWRCFVYFFFSFLTLYIKRKPNFWFVLLPLFSIQLIVIVIGNEFYNEFTEKGYLGRYVTLVVLFSSNLLLHYLAVILETGKVSTSFFLSIFGPMVFEIIAVFPLLSLFEEFNYILITSLFICYYLFVGLMHKKFININEQHLQALIHKLNPRSELEIMFMDIGHLKGICYPRKKIIIIDEKMDFPEQLQTIVHEWIHFKLWGKHKLIKPIEELLVIILEAVISWYYIVTIHRSIPIQGNK
jgi:hypothetical protein